MAERQTQRNNGSPRGYGQPARRNLRQALMRPEDEQAVGLPPQGDPNDPNQQPGNGQPPAIYPQQPQYQQPGVFQPQGFEGKNPREFAQPAQDPRQMGLGFGGDPNAQQPVQNVPPQFGGGIADAQRRAAQAGYTDIDGAQGYFTPGQFQSQLSGFNTGGWNTGERGTQSLKNTMGQLFSNYDVTQPGALQRAMSDPKFRDFLPDATIVEHPNQDLLDPDGPNGPMQPVDVIQSATAGGGGAAWAWQPQDQSGPGGPSAQAYQQALLMQPGQNQTQPVGDPSAMPEVTDDNTAMQFLQWLMQQQQQGQLGQAPQGYV